MKRILSFFLCLVFGLTSVLGEGVSEKIPGVAAGVAGGIAGTVVGVGTNLLLPGAGVVVGGITGIASGTKVFSFVDDFITGIFAEDAELKSELAFSYFEDKPIITKGNDVYLDTYSEIGMSAILSPIFSDNLTSEEIDKLKSDTQVAISIKLEGENLPLVVLTSPIDDFTLAKEGSIFEYSFQANLNEKLEYVFYVYSDIPTETKLTVLYGLDGEADKETLKANLIFENNNQR